ncbi:VWA domain-containing protein [Lentzea aerocolonigenes]|uniref:VWA domain-containing protein n=1 Tax=Lentzea aerocolonigenes TaxID=68170 RepID=UPI00068D3EB9|nr:VWA domain-containing protein [Lentzea aerocolonigenes]MCP2250987.1 tight adherence protein B [Lentzea aerocolonigenes]
MKRVLAGFLVGALLTFVFTAFASAAPSRGVVVLLDTSGSMAPDRIVVARQAIATYVSGLPADVQVGLVTFSSQPSLVLAPTADRGAVGAALDRLQAKGDTSLFDAVPVGLSALQGISERRMVIVSDGEDTVSKSTVDAAVSAVAAAGVPTDVIGFQYSDDALGRIAAAAGGRLLTASDASALAAAFAALVVPSSVPPEPTAVATPEPAPAPVAVPAPTPGLNWQTMTLIAGTFLVVFVVVMTMLTPRRSATGRKLERHLEHYGAQEAAAAPEENQAAQTAVVWTRRIMSDVSAARLSDRLDLAGMKASPAEWTLLRICTAAGLAALLTVVTTGWIGVPVGALLGWLATALVMKMRTSKRRAAFADQLPDVLQLIASSLRSGFSLAQSIDAVVRDDTQPTAGEFSRALAATRIGAELEDALDLVALRMRSADLSWVVMAVRIQRQVGGNLAEVLMTTVTTMRDRSQTRRHVRALSAEGRLSAYVLVGLPIGLAAFLFWIRPEYMRPLYTTLIGIVMLAFAAVMVVLGSLWMRKLVRVEV